MLSSAKSRILEHWESIFNKYWKWSSKSGCFRSWNIFYLFLLVSYEKKSILIFAVFFLSKKSETLYSRHLVIADTFLETAGVRYVQGWLYRIFKHIYVLFRHIHSCCGLFRIMCNSCKHSEPCHIQNPGIFRTQDIFRTLKAYSDIFRTLCNFIFIT